MPDTYTADRRELEERGCLLLRNFMPSDLLAGLRQKIQELFEEEGARAGGEFKQETGCLRLANLVNKGEIFERIVAEPEVLNHVRAVLGDQLKLSSLNARSALPENERQPLHADMGAVTDEVGPWVCNVVWMLDDFTARNGALRVVPGSHTWKCLPHERMSDPKDDHPEQELIVGPAGSVVIMNAHLWHGGLANRTDEMRTAVHSFYCRRDKPQQQYQKQLIDQAKQRGFAAPLRWLLALDDSRNDQLSRSDIPKSGFLK